MILVYFTRVGQHGQVEGMCFLRSGQPIPVMSAYVDIGDGRLTFCSHGMGGKGVEVKEGRMNVQRI
jgi:hypothetical protein